MVIFGEYKIGEMLRAIAADEKWNGHYPVVSIKYVGENPDIPKEFSSIEELQALVPEDMDFKVNSGVTDGARRILLQDVEKKVVREWIPNPNNTRGKWEKDYDTCVWLL